MGYQGVIFDLDGVLCHTDHYHYQAWKKIADELGIYFDEKINDRLRGVSRMESFEIILERYDKVMTEEEKVRCITEKNEVYKDLLKKMSPQELSPEVEETLKTLKERGIKLSIGSSSKNARFILDRLGITHYFDAISDGNNITRSKPDPEVFEKAAGYLKLEPAQCLVVEDAQAGLQAAKAGGFDCAAVGEAAKWDLADYKMESIRELLEIV